MKKKIVKQLLVCVLLVLAVIGWPLEGVSVHAREGNDVEMDLSIETEVAQSSDIINEFMRTRTGDIIYDNPQEIAAAYIPEESWCTEVCRLGDVLYIDYRVGDIRYIVAYYSDGLVEKVVRNLNDDNIYSVYSNSDIVECMNLEENKHVYSIAGEDADGNIEIMEAELKDTEEFAGRSSEKMVEPVSYTNVASTAPYTAKIVLSGNVTIDAFSGTAYKTTQEFRVYETMAYHSEVKKVTQAFAVGATITKMANAFSTSTNAVKTWLTVAGVLFSSSNILQESCQVISDHEYTFLAEKNVEYMMQQ